MIFNGRVVWIPCKIIDDEGKLKYVQPLDGWEDNRLWTSNWREIDNKLEMENEQLKKSCVVAEEVMVSYKSLIKNIESKNRKLKLELKEQKAEFGDWFNYPKSCEKLVIENDRLKIENKKLNMILRQYPHRINGEEA